MKKLLAMLLALVMVCGLATVAFAADVTYADSASTTFTITKTYTSDETFVPEETLSFTVTANSENPDTSKLISIGNDNTYKVSSKDVDTVASGIQNNITVTVPSYDKAGVYKYTIKENSGNTAGVTTYDTTSTINVIVLVEYDNVNNQLILGNDKVNGVQVFIEKINGAKVDEITNVFETNDFTVAKDVEGNMANLNDKFDITVTLTSNKPVLTDIVVGGEAVSSSDWALSNGTYTYSKLLNISENDGAVTFNNIPKGVAVSVVEDTSSNKMNGYTSDGIINGNFTIGDEETAVVVKNVKTTAVETGIALDSMPFVILLAVCAVAAVMFVIKRRRVEE